MVLVMMQRFDTMFDERIFGYKGSVGEMLRSQVLGADFKGVSRCLIASLLDQAIRQTTTPHQPHPRKGKVGSRSMQAQLKGSI